MIDEHIRECLRIKVVRSFTVQNVTGVLQYLFAVRGTPRYIRSDDVRSSWSGVRGKDRSSLAPASRCEDTVHRKDSPWENGYAESFNGKLRGEFFGSTLQMRMIRPEK